MASMISKNLYFTIARCSNEGKPTADYCKTDSEIDQFVSDIQVDSWVDYEKMHYGMYDQKPVFRVMENKGSFLLNPDISPN